MGFEKEELRLCKICKSSVSLLLQSSRSPFTYMSGVSFRLVIGREESLLSVYCTPPHFVRITTAPGRAARDDPELSAPGVYVRFGQ